MRRTATSYRLLAVALVAGWVSLVEAGAGWSLMVPPFRSSEQQEELRRMPWVQERLHAGGHAAESMEAFIEFDVEAPLSKWQRLGAYDTARACEDIRSEAFAIFKGSPRQLDWPDILLRYPHAATSPAVQERIRQIEELRAKIRESKTANQLMWVAECVSVDDPRLRP